MTILLREAIGDRLRHARTSRSRTLRDVSHEARVSLGYLSEVERGRKEASSELLASICEALDLQLSELLHTVAGDVGAFAGVDSVGERAAEVSAISESEVENGQPAHAGSGEYADLRLTERLPTSSIDVSRAGPGAFVAA